MIDHDHRKIALYCLDVGSTISNEDSIVEFSPDGRSVTITITPKKYIYHPANVVGESFPTGHVIYEAIKNWTSDYKKHKSSLISYTYHLDLPFKAKQDTVANYFEGSSGQNVLNRVYKADALITTNYYKSLLFVFEEDTDTDYHATKKAVERVFTCCTEESD